MPRRNLPPCAVRGCQPGGTVARYARAVLGFHTFTDADFLHKVSYSQRCTRSAQGGPHGALRSYGSMAARYSLILSKGTHLVDESARRRILAALENGERVVEIPVDRYQDGMTTTATVVTAHIVAFFPLDAADDLELPSNVTPLVRRG